MRQYSRANCQAALNYTTLGKEACTQWLNETLEYVEANDEITHVMIVYRYSSGLFGSNVGSFPDVPTKVGMKLIDDPGYSEAELSDIFWQSLEEIIVRLAESKKKVFLMYPIPELPTHIERGVSAFSIFSDQTMLDLDTATSKTYYQARHEFVLEKLNSIELDNVVPIRTYDYLCHDEGCPAVSGGEALYFDDDHLSVSGARKLLRGYFENNQDLIRASE